MKTIYIVLSLILLAACSGRNEKYISTDEAQDRFSGELQKKSFIVFPELRDNLIKWYDSIPEKAIGRKSDFKMKARPGEYYVYQLGVWASGSALNDVRIEFSDLESGDNVIPAARMTCFNTGGIDFRGRQFKKTAGVQADRVKPFWCGIDLDSIPAGNYKGSVKVTSGDRSESVSLSLTIDGDPVSDHGYDNGVGLSRLSWLNSNAGTDDEISKGYVPVEVKDNVISILGRTMRIAETGLPASVLSYFGPSNEALLDKSHPVVPSPFRFVIRKTTGEKILLTPGRVNITEVKPSRVRWNVLNTSFDFDLEVDGRMEFDGFIDYDLKLVAKNPVNIADIALEIPIAPSEAKYMMGLGHEGGTIDGDLKWRWDISKNQDMLWIGDVDGGLRIKLKDENYRRPLINVYYEFGPLVLPESWGNSGKGGVDVSKREGIVRAYSGTRLMQKGDTLHYNFELLLTPFRVTDRKNKYDDRYYHGGGTTNTSAKVDSAKKAGANILNIHHAEDIYPFINYPYLDDNVQAIKDLATKAHNENIRLKLYYTTRELTKNLPEFWAMYSLDGEIIYPGPGNEAKTVINPKGPNEWLIKNLRENYIPAWFNVIEEGRHKGETDLSVITTPDSRLNNFYVAGLDWMVRNLEIDGVYIDDSALDRYTLMRARKIIDRYRPEGRMDLHSWNHFNKWAGYTNCLNLYMDLLPYFDLVWIGEGRDYNRAPDHWLIEVSGIPFGLPGQMLEGGGNPWRGMVYGITTRAGYLGNSPSGLWKFWDEHKFEEKTMTGYWDENCPVSSHNDSIKVTVYRDDHETIAAIANWGVNDQPAKLSFKGADLRTLNAEIPYIADFQDAQEKLSISNLVIPGKKGYLIIIRNSDLKGASAK